MKIYISTDLEGVTGVWKYSQINRDSLDYLEAARMLISPEETSKMLTEGARQAVAKIPELSPYKVKLPIKLVVKRKGPEGATPENPYYVEEERIVKKILPFDIITGSKD